MFCLSFLLLLFLPHLLCRLTTRVNAFGRLNCEIGRTISQIFAFPREAMTSIYKLMASEFYKHFNDAAFSVFTLKGVTRSIISFTDENK